MASDAPIWPLINLLRLKRAVGHCRRCGKVAYRSRWDAQAIADLTFAVQGDVMRPYRQHGHWHLYTVQPRTEPGRTYDHDAVVGTHFGLPVLAGHVRAH